MTTEFVMVRSDEALRQTCDTIRQHTCAAIDTEFVWDRTYYAELGLVQVGLPDQTVYLIDPLGIEDLSPLGEILSNPNITKVLHDAVQDLMILYRATGHAAVSIFDTRTAAGFCGLSCVISLQKLFEALFDITLPKGATRTDWIARPLTPEQLSYAVDDVERLPEAAEKLKSMAKDKGLADWVSEEMALLNDANLYQETPLKDSWQRFSAADKLKPENLAALKLLAEWQETTARDRNKPRSWIAKDKEVVSVAFDLPTDMTELKKCRKMDPRTARRWGKAMLAAVEASRSKPVEPDTRSRDETPKFSKEELAEFIAHIKGLAENRSIDPQLMGNKKEMTQLLTEGHQAQPKDHRLLRGWRAELVGETLIPFFDKYA